MNIIILILFRKINCLINIDILSNYFISKKIIYVFFFNWKTNKQTNIDIIIKSVLGYTIEEISNNIIFYLD
jgi:hypothetical protein